MNKKENFLKGFVKENPIFVFLLGMCPALAVTAAFETALGMGILVIFVLTSSNLVVSLVRNFIPSDVRTPAYIVIIATFVTVVGMLAHSYVFPLYEALGVFIPLIVVNCLILGRAEAFASKNSVLDSIIDGLGMGLGFTMSLVIIAISRELISTGQLMYGVYLPLPSGWEPFAWFDLDWLFFMFNDLSVHDYMLPMFGLAPGAFIALGIILAIIQNHRNVQAKKAEIKKQQMIEEKKRIALEKKQAALKKAGEQA
jgi:electron transport complex protein RnfE